MGDEKKEKSSDNKDGKKNEEAKKQDSFHIPLRLIPNDKEDIAQEMQDLFDEDKVTHRQGPSEPEAD